MPRPFKNKLRVRRGFEQTECSWVVEQFYGRWVSIAEFWNRNDAFIFIKSKRKLISSK